MGVLPQIDALANNGLLILPESEQMLPAKKNQGTDDFQFVHLQDLTHLYHPLFSKITYIPIFIETDATQPTPDGPSLEVRRELLKLPQV